MKIKNLAIAITILAISSASFAMSGAIYKSRDNECAIYLCLPQLFKPTDCKPAWNAMKDRILKLNWKGKRVYTPLPYFHLCLDKMAPDMEAQIEQLIDETGFDEAIKEHPEFKDFDRHAPTPDTRQKMINYRIVTPEHTECTNWRPKRSGNHFYGSTCIADKTVPEVTRILKKPRHIKYKVSKVGDEKEDEKTFNSLIYERSGIYVDNQLIGEIHEEQIWEYE